MAQLHKHSSSSEQPTAEWCVIHPQATASLACNLEPTTNNHTARHLQLGTHHRQPHSPLPTISSLKQTNHTHTHKVNALTEKVAADHHATTTEPLRGSWSDSDRPIYCYKVPDLLSHFQAFIPPPSPDLIQAPLTQQAATRFLTVELRFGSFEFWALKLDGDDICESEVLNVNKHFPNLTCLEPEPELIRTQFDFSTRSDSLYLDRIGL